MDFNGKNVVVTGGASGIGLLCGQCYAREGANVVLVDVDDERLSAAAKEINESGGRALAAVCDVRDYAQVESACAAADPFGGVDIMVNCAGGASARIFGCDKAYYEYPVEYLDWGIDVNLKGPMYFARAAMARMVRKRGGVIIVMGSISGEEGCANSVDYATAKSGLMTGFVRSLAQSGAPYGIRACCVSPGPVLTRKAMANMKTLLGRAAQPQEIADLILYLSSDRAAFVTGSNYMIDGGRSSMIVQ